MLVLVPVVVLVPILMALVLELVGGVGLGPGACGGVWVRPD
jgi:hypothetical protein